MAEVALGSFGILGQIPFIGRVVRRNKGNNEKTLLNKGTVVTFQHCGQYC